MSSVFNLSDEEAVDKFRTINDKSILYFTATWCPPCKAIKPVYEKMSKDHPEVAFGKVDIDDNAEAAAKYEVSIESCCCACSFSVNQNDEYQYLTVLLRPILQISGVPTFILFDKEKVFNRFTGADQNQLEQSVSSLKVKEA